MNFFKNFTSLLFAVTLGSSLATAQTGQPEPSPSETAQSPLEAQDFYEILLAEIKSNDPYEDLPSAYNLYLDVAHRLGNEDLYKRAVELALSARAGESALQATRAWVQAHPDSLQAKIYLLNILLSLNKVEETVEPMQHMLKATAAQEKFRVYQMARAFYQRIKDEQVAVRMMRAAFADELEKTEYRAQAWSTMGAFYARLQWYGDAMEALERAHAADTQSTAPVYLAVELMSPDRARAEGIIKEYLSQHKDPDVRLEYVRALVRDQRSVEARAELEDMTRNHPDFAPSWLLLGVMQADQETEKEQARASLQRAIDLLEAQKTKPSTQALNTPASQQASKEMSDAYKSKVDGQLNDKLLTQAYMMQSQLAQQRKDYAQAQAWLKKIPPSSDSVALRMRYADLLGAQGLWDQAQQHLSDFEPQSAEQERMKVFAQVKLLREQKQYQRAYDFLAHTRERVRHDTELIYEQAMMAEKLSRLDEMESLLREIIKLDPKNANAYNALGYSFADRGVRLEEAKELIERAVALEPDNWFIADSLAWVEYKLGNLPKAQEILEQAYKHQSDPEIAAHLGEVLWEAGQRERAITVWRQALKEHKDNEVLQEVMRKYKVNASVQPL